MGENALATDENKGKIKNYLARKGYIEFYSHVQRYVATSLA